MALASIDRITSASVDCSIHQHQMSIGSAFLYPVLVKTEKSFHLVTGLRSIVTWLLVLA